MPSCEQMGTTSKNVEFWALVKRVKNRPYEDAESAWNELLAFLGLPLRAQPLLGIVMAEGRFAKAKDPRAYLAMSARNQAKRANLLKQKGDKRGAIREAEAGAISDVTWSVKVRGGTLCLKAESHDEFIELASYHNDNECIEDAGILRKIPYWLRLPDEDAELLETLGYTVAVDWIKVAEHAVSSASMLRSVSFVLMRRYGLGQTAKRMIETKDPELSPQQIQSAWRWIDRNFETKIKPLFAMKGEPQQHLAKTEPASFVSPGAALLLAGNRSRRTLESYEGKPISSASPLEKGVTWYEVSPPRAVVAVHRVSTQPSRKH